MIADSIDWSSLAGLRAKFLEKDFSTPNYWSSEKLLADYDATFAARIGWKWDAVMLELKRRGWKSGGRHITDWGCGSGIASRKYLEHLGADQVDSVTLWDASPEAMRFAEQQLTRKYPTLNVRRARQAPYKEPGILLMSHIINELDDAAMEQVVATALRSEAVVWVEPGSREESRALSAARDRLLPQLHPFAPCTHGNRCPMLQAEHEVHWCHHFTRPPAEVHQSPHWSAFARDLGIDLGTVPYSFLAMHAAETDSEPDGGYTRLIGHPRTFKKYLRLLCCDSDGLNERSLTPASDKAIYREVKKEDLFPVFRCEVRNQRISSIARWGESQ